MIPYNIFRHLYCILALPLILCLSSLPLVRLLPPHFCGQIKSLLGQVVLDAVDVFM